jgi:catechol 2,3-dioxygenase-like lactoylglutathione lyase family enzyme
MAPRAFSHIAVGVSDMDSALVFWRDVMDLGIDLDTIEEVPGPDGSPRRRRGVYLRWEQGDDATFVVLDQQLTIEPFGTPSKLFELGVHHVSFWVDDVEPYRIRALDLGFTAGEPTDSDTVAYGEAAGRGVRTAFLRDGDGTFVQLDQRLD